MGKDNRELGASLRDRAATPSGPSPAVSGIAGIPSAGVCAFDLDECTVTLALDSPEEVRGLVAALPARGRVKVLDEVPVPSDPQMDAEVVAGLREAAYRVLGGNCAFADDDVRLLAALAELAVAAGLTQNLHGTVLDSINRKHRLGKYATASGMEARQGEDADAASSRSDDSPTGEAGDAQTANNSRGES